jgi:hypothetical protein
MSTNLRSPRRSQVPALLLALSVLLLTSCGDANNSEPSANATGPEQPIPSEVAVSRTTATQTTRSSKMSPGDRNCSANQRSPDVPADPILGGPAAQMRADLAQRSATCDWSALALLVDRNGPGVRANYGDDTNPIEYWHGLDNTGADSGPKPMLALRILLGLPAKRLTSDGGTIQFAWPRAAAGDQPSDAELQEIADTGIYTLAQLRDWRAAGTGYLGYRVLITADGDWTAFVRGD